MLVGRLVADPRNRPEVICKRGVLNVVVGHVEAPSVTPFGAPGVEDDKYPPSIAIADGARSMAALHRVGGTLRHGHFPAELHARRCEGAVHDEPKDEGLASGEAALELRQLLRHSFVARGSEGLARPVARRRRPLIHLAFVIGPLGLWTHAPALHRLDGVAEAPDAGFGLRGLLERQIEVDEAETWHKVCPPLPMPLLPVEVEGRGDGARDTAAALAGIVWCSQEVSAKIHLVGQALGHHLAEVGQAVPRVDFVGDAGEGAVPPCGLSIPVLAHATVARGHGRMGLFIHVPGVRRGRVGGERDPTAVVRGFLSIGIAWVFGACYDDVDLRPLTLSLATLQPLQVGVGTSVGAGTTADAEPGLPTAVPYLKD
mmetsp:Transcript_11469/g.36680  ORF Transcript_11469/g.36680 Transcript_11469/m.36680 type:complete len:371 (+) Transcript_11469:61-1173(+)